MLARNFLRFCDVDSIVANRQQRLAKKAEEKKRAQAAKATERKQKRQAATMPPSEGTEKARPGLVETAIATDSDQKH